jgi:hypothetical protein
MTIGLQTKRVIVGNKLGEYFISRSETTACVRLMASHKLDRADQTEILEIMRGCDTDNLVALNPRLLPVEITKVFVTANIWSDVRSLCTAVVFCSNLVHETTGWVPGLVIEPFVGKGSPNEVSQADISWLAQAGDDPRAFFIADPTRAIFLNFYGSDEQLRQPTELFESAVRFVGYLKAKDRYPHNSYTFKEGFAALYELSIAEKLLHILSYDTAGDQAVRQRLESWLGQARLRLDQFASAMGTQEREIIHHQRYSPTLSLPRATHKFNA